MWIKRDISVILQDSNHFVEILIGPRQCGKSSLLLRLDQEFIELSMDDFSIRQLALKDPQAFLKQYAGQKVLIDEVQLVPEIFYAIKREVDLLKRANAKRKTYFRLTGSNQILIEKNVKESLAGRASYYELNTLSVKEIFESNTNVSIRDIIFKGGWPELYKDSSLKPQKYLDDYIKKYIEKDIVLAAGIQKQKEFTHFAVLLASRTGQILNQSDLAKEIGVSTEAIREWVSILERMKIVLIVQPYFSNLSKRLVKSPKVYFLDTGLATRLQGHSEPAPMFTSPSFGPLFETLVINEIYKTIINFGKSWKTFHWRSRDGEEIDFLIELEKNKKIFIEAKVAFQTLAPVDEWAQVKKVFKGDPPARILCHLDGENVLKNSVPIKFLGDYLLRL